MIQLDYMVLWIVALGCTHREQEGLVGDECIVECAVIQLKLGLINMQTLNHGLVEGWMHVII